MKNNLMVINNKEQWTIGSREVSEMMEVRHDSLLRKIEGINNDFNVHKIVVVKYWVESTYIDIKGEQRKEYLVTKRGCEFLAHKTTGTKGNLFTDRYMDKFEEMEKQIKEQVKQDSYIIADSIERAKRWIEEEETRILLEAKVKEQQPKVDYYDKVLNCSKLITVTEIAKDLGMSAIKLNRILEERGIQFKKGENWFLYSNYNYLIDDKYADYQINEHKQALKWTEKGRRWIISDILNN